MTVDTENNDGQPVRRGAHFGAPQAGEAAAAPRPDETAAFLDAAELNARLSALAGSRPDETAVYLDAAQAERNLRAFAGARPDETAVYLSAATDGAAPRLAPSAMGRAHVAPRPVEDRGEGESAPTRPTGASAGDPFGFVPTIDFESGAALDAPAQGGASRSVGGSYSSASAAPAGKDAPRAAVFGFEADPVLDDEPAELGAVDKDASEDRDGPWAAEEPPAPSSTAAFLMASEGRPVATPRVGSRFAIAAAASDDDESAPATEVAPVESAAPDDEDEAAMERANKSSNMVSVLVIISRITGFLRTSMQAWALGAAGLASAYTVANQMPNFLYELVVGGMLVTSFLPVYLRVKTRLGKEGASEYASNLLSIVALLMLFLTVLSFIFAAPIIWTQSAGASEGFDFELAVWFFRWFCCSTVLYALSSVFSGVLNAERDYLWSNLAPVFNNVITIATFVVYGYLTRNLGVPQAEAIYVLAIGSPLGILVQVLCQVPALYRYGIRLKLRLNLKDPALRDTLSIGIPTLVAVLASAPTTAVTSSCALSVTPAGASISYYARVWYVLPYSIFAIPISVTMFTELSSSFQKDDLPRFREYLADGLRKLCFTLIPCAMFLAVFAPSLIAVFTAGAFSEDAAAMTAGYLQALAPSLLFYALSSYLQKVCSSMMRMNFFAVASVVGSVLQVVICIWLTPLFGLYVVPLSSTLFYGSIDLLTLIIIRRQLGAIGMRSVVAAVLRALALGAAGSLVGWGIVQGLTLALGPASGMLRGVLYSAAGGLPALVVTFGIASALGISDAPFFDAIFGRLFRRRRAAA